MPDPTPTPEAPRRLEARTATFATAYQELGISRTCAYDLVRRGEFPLPVIRAGRLMLVARADLERLLGGEAGR